jgi:hypothetical protein
MRFNDAKVESYEADVGGRPPTIRLINGQLMLKAGHRLRKLVDNWIKENSTVIVWHHCCCGIEHFKQVSQSFYDFIIFNTSSDKSELLA